MKILLIGLFFSLQTNIAFSDAIDDALNAQTKPSKTKVSVERDVLTRSKDAEALTYRRAIEKERERAEEMATLDAQIDVGKKCKDSCYKATPLDEERTRVTCLIGLTSGNSETVWHYRGGSTFQTFGATGFKSFDEAARFACRY